MFYGSIATSHKKVKQVYIDTVLVVERSVEWPTGSGGRGRKKFRLMTDKKSLDTLKDNLNIVNKLHSSSAWKYCLKDSKNNHKFTAWNPHMIILGTSNPLPKALSKAKTSFVPVVPESAEAPLALLPDKHLEDKINILIKKYPRLCGSIKPIIPLDRDIALELYHRVAILSETEREDHIVAVPPLTPVTLKRRHTDKQCSF